MIKIFSFAALAATTFLATAGGAAVTSYTNKAAFVAAAGSTQTETFGAAPVGKFASSGANGNFNQAFDGFSVSGQNFGNYVGIATGAVSSGGPNTTLPASFVGQNYLTWANQTGDVVSITINLNQATTAFGFDWFNSDYTDQYTFSVTAGGVTSTYSGPPWTVVSGNQTTANVGFFGLVSDTAFTTATITNNFFGGYISDEGFDNLITNGVGSTNPTVPGAVPEPASWAMMIGGFGMVGAAMRRRPRTTVRFA